MPRISRRKPLSLVPVELSNHQMEFRENRDVLSTAEPVSEDVSLSFQAEIDTLFDGAFSFFGEPTVFGNMDIEATRTALSETLDEIYGDDRRVSEFLDAWDTTRDIMSLRAEYNAAGASDSALRDQIFALLPSQVLPKAFDLGVELLQPSEEVLTPHSAWLEDWLVLASQAEVAHVASTLANDAYIEGEITVQEAEAFVEEVSGLDVNVTPLD